MHCGQRSNGGPANTKTIDEPALAGPDLRVAPASFSSALTRACVFLRRPYRENETGRRWPPPLAAAAGRRRRR
jgi:hypothetical protein